jgi:UDP-glucose 4-epimerase
MKKIAITGSSGFVGKYMISILKDSKYEIIELDLDKGYDVTKLESLNLLIDVDFIIHFASRSSVIESFKNPAEYYFTNYIMTLNVLECARRMNSKVIYFSSYIYGTPVYLPIDELHPINPHNPYAQSKLICEKLCEGYNRDFGLDILVFRPFNIYGKGQNSAFLLPSIVKQSLTGIITLNDPRPKRDFIHVLDVVKAVKNAIELSPSGYCVFNLGFGKSYSISELVEIMSDIIGDKLSIKYTNQYRKGEVMNTVASNSRAKKILNWEPKVDIRDGLRQML